MNTYYVYIMINNNNTVLYTGMTSNLIKRVYEHKNELVEGFTKKYKCHKLVWYDATNDVLSAITKEKQIKNWKREYKLNIINKMNPEWKDLYSNLIGE